MKVYWENKVFGGKGNEYQNVTEHYFLPLTFIDRFAPMISRPYYLIWGEGSFGKTS